VQPEGKVAATLTAVDDIRDHQHRKAEPERHDATLVPGELGAADDPRREVHRHEPERERDDQHDERIRVSP
jgi:hypothetical protein